MGSGLCWVVDTSPLVFLAKLDRLELLRRGAKEILVPTAVIEEVRQYRDEAARHVEVALTEWLNLRPVEDKGLLGLLRADLGSGEAEVLALARETGADRIIMDDEDGRRYAARLGLERMGTLGLLLAARLRGEIPSLADEIERLRHAGFRAKERLLRAVLQEAGELT